MSTYIGMIFLFMAFAALFVAPGFFLYCLIFKDRRELDYLQAIPISLVFSISMATPFIFLLYIRSLPLDYLIYFLCVLTLILFWQCRKIRRFPTMSFPLKDPYFLTMSIMLFALIVFAAITGGIAAGVKTYDSYYYIANIRQIATTGLAIPFDPYIKEARIVNPFYPYNPLFVIFGLLARICKIEALRLWLWLPAILAPLSALAVYSFLVSALRNRRASLFISTVILLSDLFYFSEYSWFGISKWQAMAYPNKIGFYIFMPVIASLVFLYSKKGSPAYLGSIVLSGIGFMGCYLGGIPALAISLFLFCVFILLFKDSIAQQNIVIKRVCLAIALVVCVYGSYLVTLKSLGVKIGQDALGGITTTSLIAHYREHFYVFHKYLFMLKPKYLFDDWLRIAALPISIFLLTKRKKLDTLYFFSITIGITCILLFPPLAGILGNILPWLFLERLKFLIPANILMGYLIFYAVNRLSRRQQTAALMAVGLIFLSYGAYRAISVKITQKNGIIFPDAISYLLKYEIPPQSVVLSDEYSSYVIPAIADLRIVGTAKGVNTLTMPQGEARLHDIRQLRKNLTGDETLIDMLSKYRVDYVFIRKWFWCDKGERFARRADIFTRVYETGDYSIYRVKRVIFEE